jgi:hypothetical protein
MAGQVWASIDEAVLNLAGFQEIKLRFYNRLIDYFHKSSSTEEK